MNKFLLQQTKVNGRRTPIGRDSPGSCSHCRCHGATDGACDGGIWREPWQTASMTAASGAPLVGSPLVGSSGFQMRHRTGTNPPKVLALDSGFNCEPFKIYQRSDPCASYNKRGSLCWRNRCEAPRCHRRISNNGRKEKNGSDKQLTTGEMKVN